MTREFIGGVIRDNQVFYYAYNAISSLAHEVEEPIYITENGEGDLVVMSIEAFEKREQVLRLRSKITMAERSRLDGERTVSLDEARKRLEEIYNNEEV